ncbi:MAG TPA: hypothetical protein VHB98_23650, partial [Chloroflexota bacterium]|nr:hypothetical protein [Chloroflexota bacterium]
MMQIRTHSGRYALTLLAGSWVLVVLGTVVSYGVGMLIVQQGQPTALGLAGGLLAGVVVLLGLPMILSRVNQACAIPEAKSSEEQLVGIPVDPIKSIGSSTLTTIEKQALLLKVRGYSYEEVVETLSQRYTPSPARELEFLIIKKVFEADESRDASRQ